MDGRQHPGRLTGWEQKITLLLSISFHCTGWLVGILISVCYNPCITGQLFIPYITQPTRFFLMAHVITCFFLEELSEAYPVKRQGVRLRQGDFQDASEFSMGFLGWQLVAFQEWYPCSKQNILKFHSIPKQNYPRKISRSFTPNFQKLFLQNSIYIFVRCHSNFPTWVVFGGEIFGMSFFFLNLPFRWMTSRMRQGACVLSSVRFRGKIFDTKFCPAQILHSSSFGKKTHVLYRLAYRF